MSKKKHRCLPRETPDRINRYMGLAWMWASMSHDPSTQVGCVIISVDNRPLGSGYNGPPRQIPDNEVDWSRPNKYAYIKHAEKNAIKYCSEPPKGATLYVTSPPCKDCMIDILDAGISKVVYFNHRSDKGSMLVSNENWEIVKNLAKTSHVTLEEYQGNLNWIRDWTDSMYSKGIFG